MIIEVAGPPGAGKTTLVATIVDTCRRHGRTPYRLDDAARPFAARTLPGRLVARSSTRFAEPATWGLFATYRAVYAARYLVGHPRLVGHLWTSQRRRPAAADARRRQVVRWFVRMIGAREFAAAWARPDEVIVVDEGFAHRVVQLHTSSVERPDATTVRAYAAVTAAPDLLVHVDAPADLCLRRVRRRGVWARWSGHTDAEIGEFVNNAKDTLDVLTAELEGSGWSVIHVDNAGAAVRPAAAQLADEIGAFLDHHHEGVVRR